MKDPHEREPAPTAASLEERLATWRDAFPHLDDAVAHELRANLDLRWTHHSTAIEGNRLSHSDAAQVLMLPGRPK